MCDVKNKMLSKMLHDTKSKICLSEKLSLNFITPWSKNIKQSNCVYNSQNKNGLKVTLLSRIYGLIFWIEIDFNERINI